MKDSKIIVFIALLATTYYCYQYSMCILSDQCSSNGWCTSFGCICNSEYITYNSLFGKECNYKKKCLTGEQCNYNGFCDDTGSFCFCNKNFITFKSVDNTECNYQQKNSIMAIILHLIIGITGATNFYLENYNEGFSELIVLLLSMYYLIKSLKHEYRYYDLRIFAIVYLFWTYNFVFILMNWKLDGNRAPLSEIH